MSKLRERTIQLKALHHLKKEYEKKFSIDSDKLYAKDEVRTKKKSGGKRADGLLCFEKDGKPYTISLEAKSHRTLDSLISFYNNDKFGLHSLFVSALITLISTLALAYYTDIRWYFIALIAISSIIAFYFISAMIFSLLDLDNHKIIGVVNQLSQYPANEQWIAFSKHTNKLLSDTDFSWLEKMCKKNGFGLLVVTKNDCKITVCPIPKKGEFLLHYSKELEILKAIRINV